MYVNPETDQFWIIDYRLYDLDRDGHTKLDHVRDMLNNALHEKGPPFRGVLMDSWYAERKLMLHIKRVKWAEWNKVDGKLRSHLALES